MPDKSTAQIQILAPIPVLRIFDRSKATEFYEDYLGMSVDWTYQGAVNAPGYMQVSRSMLRMHLSEHFGDASPGARLFIPMEDLEGLHKELTQKKFRFANPSIEKMPWGRELQLTDPFGNRLTFCRQEAG